MSTLVDRMVANLQESYDDDPDEGISDESQYLLEHVETLEDLFHFLNEEEELAQWNPAEIFGFVLCLIDPAPGFDHGTPLSDGYRSAVDHVEDRKVRVSDPDIFAGHRGEYG